MKALHYLKLMLQQGEYMFKLDLEDAYFSVPYSNEPRKMICFRWVRNHMIFETCVDANTQELIFRSKSTFDSNDIVTYPGEILKKVHQLRWEMYKIL